MKKYLFLYLLLIFLTSSLSAQLRFGTIEVALGANRHGNISGFEYGFNIGNISYDISCLNEKIIPGLGVTWIPLNYTVISDDYYLNLINFQIYWDIYKFLDTVVGIDIPSFIFGPFVSINYAPNFDFNNYVFCAGIRFIAALDEVRIYIGGYNHIKLNILNIECYYKSFEGKNSIYFGVTFDLLCLAFPGIIGFLPGV
jgi:hypothetical protein